MSKKRIAQWLNDYHAMIKVYGSTHESETFCICSDEDFTVYNWCKVRT
jgi:hypothetical protein